MDFKNFKEKQTFIKFDGDSIECGFYILYIHVDDLWWIRIPAYQISFSVSSKEQGRNMALISIRSFFDVCAKNNLWKNWEEFSAYIHNRLGFQNRTKGHRSNQLYAGRPSKAKLLLPKGRIPEVKTDSYPSEIHYEVVQCVPHKS